MHDLLNHLRHRDIDDLLHLVVLDPLLDDNLGHFYDSLHDLRHWDIDDCST